jgi:CubicO group peptidase (beta-lactamase class C family)
MMPPRPGLARAVEEAARRAMATSTTPGLAAALVHHSQVAWAAGYGAADRQRDNRSRLRSARTALACVMHQTAPTSHHPVWQPGQG